MVSNYGYLMSTQGNFQIKLPLIFIYEWSSSSVWSSKCKNTFVGTGNLQMITNKYWCEYLWVTYVLILDTILYIVLVFSEIEAYNLRSWLHESNQPVNWDRASLCTKASHSILLQEIFTSLETNEFFEVIYEFKWKQPATKWLGQEVAFWFQCWKNSTRFVWSV